MMTAMQRGTSHSKSTLAKMRDAAAKRWTPKKRASHSKIMKRVISKSWTAERHAAHSEAMRAYHARRRTERDLRAPT
jgi:hypothetical protein